MGGAAQALPTGGTTTAAVRATQPTPLLATGGTAAGLPHDAGG